MLSSKKPARNTVKHKVTVAPKPGDPITTVTVPYKSLATFLKAISGCIDEAVLNILDEKLLVKTVDGGNVSMIIAECPCKAEFQKQSPRRVGINIPLLNKALLHAKGCDVTMSISESTISLKYGRFSAKVCTVDCTQLRKEVSEPPKILHPCEISLPGKYLDEICRTVSGAGKIRIFIEDRVVMLRAEEGDLCITEVVGTAEGRQEANSLFSAALLKDISKSVKDVGCTITAGIDHPASIAASVNDCTLQFYLAPRIEAD
jgi:DNA polymerase III sliding clamp (beta) subunit (PCNA family)